jgi:hypothetical protein
MPKKQDEGDRIIHSQSPRLLLGVAGTWYFHKNYALDFGIQSNNIGLDVNYKGFIFSANQGATIVQLPIRLNRTLIATRDKILRWEAVLGGSYLYNWNKGWNGTTYLFGIGQNNENDVIYDTRLLKTHILWLEFGLKGSLDLRRVRLSFSALWNRAFTPIAEVRGTYTYEQQARDFKITSMGKNFNLALGLQYRFDLHNRSECIIAKANRTQAKQHRRLTAVPDSLHSMTQFTAENRLALTLGSPLFFPRIDSQGGKGEFDILASPGLTVGLDYYTHFNTKWAFHTGLRVGLQSFAYRYKASRADLNTLQDLRGTSATAQRMFQLPVGLLRRIPLNPQWVMNIEAGAQLYSFSNEGNNYYQSTFQDQDFNQHLNVYTNYEERSTPLNITPYLQVGVGKRLRNGCMLQADVSLQPGIATVMNGSYDFVPEGATKAIGSGSFSSKNGGINFQLSYVFNSLKRQIRKRKL